MGRDKLSAVDVVKVIAAVLVLMSHSPANGVHVRNKAVSHKKVVVMQGQALPLGQGMDHLPGFAHSGDVKAHRALHAVQVVVKARGRVHKEGRGDAFQMQGGAELYLEDILDQADGLLGIVEPKRGGIVLRDGSHKGSQPFG